MLNTILWIVGVVALVWVLYDVWTQQKSMGTGEKVVWSILSVVFSILTAIVYYFMKKR